LERTHLTRKTFESYKLIAKSTAKLTDEKIFLKKHIGVEVYGMTVCPCAMESARKKLMERFEQNIDIINRIPMVTHNQRNKSTLIIEVPETHDIEANDLIQIVEKSLSSPTFELLKRGDEGDLVLTAHENPKFVEDVVRDILKKVVEKYENLPDDVVVFVKSESEESIHKHNAIAEIKTTLGKLRCKTNFSPYRKS
jgi:GTP cyclohydrolase-4